MKNPNLAPQPEEDDIQHYLSDFRFDEEISDTNLAIWYAQRDIEIANRNIADMSKAIASQHAAIKDAKIAIKQLKQAQADETGPARGRPGRQEARQKVLAKFTVQWVKSLMESLEVKNAKKMEDAVRESNQREWRRWLAGESTPTVTSLARMSALPIRQGKLQGMTLEDVPTTPSLADLCSLVRLS